MHRDVCIHTQICIKKHYIHIYIFTVIYLHRGRYGKEFGFGVCFFLLCRVSFLRLRVYCVTIQLLEGLWSHARCTYTK